MWFAELLRVCCKKGCLLIGGLKILKGYKVDYVSCTVSLYSLAFTSELSFAKNSDSYIEIRCHYNYRFNVQMQLDEIGYIEK